MTVDKQVTLYFVGWGILVVLDESFRLLESSVAALDSKDAF